MQASKSRDDLDRFDLYDCLTCRTAIVESPTKPNPSAGSPSKR
jgi:hypothetical protein